MNLNQIKNYTKGVLQGWFLNKPALDKISESNDGKILYNNKEIDVTEQVASIKKYQKYLNTELDYFHGMYNVINTLSYTSANLPVRIIYDNITENNNIEYDSSTGLFKLKANKTYRIDASVRVGLNIASQIAYRIINNNTQTVINVGGVHNTSSFENSHWTSKECQTIVTFKENTEIYVEIYSINNSATITTIQSNISIFEIGRQITIDPVEYINESQGLEDTPVGHIISHMGTIAPKHYLICNGTEYNISDYPYLAQHIIDSFGSVNYFGGDGTTTFAVPDLRGEFLRGTGTATRNTGSGEEVGKHQDGTEHADTLTNSQYSIAAPRRIWGYGANRDSIVNSIETYNATTNIVTNTLSGGGTFTSRPTNTSVLYCIKYEPTYFMVKNNTNYLQPTLYSEEEKCIGSWINGKPLYKKTIITTLPTVSTNGTLVEEVEDIGIENIDIATNLEGFIIKDNASVSINASTKNPPNADAFSCIFYREATLVKRSSVPGWNNCPVYITLQYTKTTDAENSFNQNMITDFIIQGSGSEEILTQEQIQAAIDEDVF